MSHANPPAREEVTEMTINRIRLDSLTAMRFFAAFGVTLCHLVVPLAIPGSLGFSFIFWQFGVDFFFVLSGFVLTWSWKPQRPIKRFYWLRFARIGPLHVSVLLLLVLLGTRARLTTVLPEVLLVQQWYPKSGYGYRVGLNDVDWTLSVEALFYAIFPFIIGMLSRRSTKALAGITGAVWLVFGCVGFAAAHSTNRFSAWISDTSPYCRIPEFILGIAIAFCLKRFDIDNISRAWDRNLKLMGMLGLFLTLLTFARTQTPQSYKSVTMPEWSFALMPMIACMIVGFALTGMRGTSRTPRFLVALGEWSFALYLVHRGIVYDHVLPHLHHWPRPLAALCVLTLSIALSGLIFVLIERPVERWLRARGPREHSQGSAPTQA